MIGPGRHRFSSSPLGSIKRIAQRASLASLHRCLSGKWGIEDSGFVSSADVFVQAEMVRRSSFVRSPMKACTRVLVLSVPA